MKVRKILAFLIIILTFNLPINAKKDNTKSFETGKKEFLLNGKPFTIRAAELHYPRIPKEYWENRILLSKALGMNTICLYTFWNLHEEKEGEFDFSDNKDLREFVRLCDAHDMKVILRPGPYVCAEWEMGGLPWWLLKKKDIGLRENDPYFLEKVERFEEAVASQISDLTIDNGGPIIMIQVENEYGSYGENKEYISKIRDILRELYGDNILLFQCDWSSNFTLNGLDDLLWTMNFGTGADIDSQFESLKSLRPESPLMCSEYWSGWFDKWGASHETRSAEEMISGIDEMLAKDISFSLYMTHGGTNWGHWAGANSPGYSPDVTSYDYDAPISENGQTTDKYFLLRNTISKHLKKDEKLPEVPITYPTGMITKFELSEVAPLFENMPMPILDEKIRPIEDYDMGFGSVVYSTLLPPVESKTTLTVTDPHDYAQVFINGELMGILDRRLGEKEIILPSIPRESKLEILVEATGRINFGREIKDYKGITEKVTLTRPGEAAAQELKDWEVYLIPDDTGFYNSMNFIPLTKKNEDPGERLPRGVYRGTFRLDDVFDTFLNFETWGKGLVYVNGRGVGRIWNIGPQQTLYVPAPLLREGENELLIIDILGPESAEVEGLEKPIIDKLNITEKINENNGLLSFDPEKDVPVIHSSFNSEPGWKEIIFDSPVKGRYLKFEIENCQHEEKAAAIAELDIIGVDDEKISRESWKALADSENNKTGNHNAEKIFDLQESTYWESEISDNGKHYIIIDLGGEKLIKGLRQLPRADKDNPGAIKEYKIYIK